MFINEKMCDKENYNGNFQHVKDYCAGKTFAFFSPVQYLGLLLLYATLAIHYGSNSFYDANIFGLIFVRTCDCATLFLTKVIYLSFLATTSK